MTAGLSESRRSPRRVRQRARHATAASRRGPMGERTPGGTWGDNACQGGSLGTSCSRARVVHAGPFTQTWRNSLVLTFVKNGKSRTEIVSSNL